MIRHDPACPACGGRGHILVDPATGGFTLIEERPNGDKIWRGPSGGVHTFTKITRGKLMVLCSCVQEITP